MQPSKFIKGLTLLSFASLIIVFLLYRTGQFNTSPVTEEPVSIQTSHNGGSIKTSVLKKTKPKAQPSQKLLLSSSKSIVVTASPQAFFDSLVKPELNPRQRRTQIMSSSKSGIIFTPNTYLNVDSLRNERNKKIKAKP